MKDIVLNGVDLKLTESGEVFNKSLKRRGVFTDKYGYKYIVIRKGGARKKYLVHRLIAKAFIDNKSNLPEVNHIDGNKANNNVENLEWVTTSENQLHSRYSLGNQTGFHDVPIVCIETGKTYKSTRDAWRATGVGYSHISECANGKRKTAGGYHWGRM